METKMADEMTGFKVTRVTQETERMRLLTMSTGSAWSFIPGQVAVLSLDGKGQSYFAIASAPEDTEGMEFLIRDSTGGSHVFYNLVEGSSLIGKGPVGNGFPIDNYKGRDILLAAVGSAISPMRSVLRSIVYRRSDFGRVTLVFGFRNPGDVPFRKEMDDWKADRIDVVLTASRPDAGWKGETGHVQAHFDKVLQSLQKPLVLICGMKEMMEQGKAELVKLNVALDDILTNY